MDTENSRPSHFKLKKVEIINAKGVYDRLINWVIGEFDLYLMNESDSLKVYFPNGSFLIGNYKNENGQEVIKIKVKGKSKFDCQRMMDKLESIYDHVLRFTNEKLHLNN